MRGVSNVISAIFVVAAILVAGYITLSAYIQHTTELTITANKALERAMLANHVEYGKGECNTAAGTIKIPVTGTEPDYAVRFLCYDLANATDTICAVPYVATGSTSAQYVGPKFPGTVELNMAACPDLNDACNTERLECVAVGTYGTQKIPVLKAE